MKYNTQILFVLLAFLIIQTCAAPENSKYQKINEVNSKLHNSLENVAIFLVRLRTKSLELLENYFANAIIALRKWYNDEVIISFDSDTEVGLFCLQETTTKIFAAYREAESTVISDFNDNLAEMERIVAAKFQAGVELDSLINVVMNDCNEKKKNDSKIDCSSSADFQNVTRSVMNYTEKNEAIIKRGFGVEDRMTITTKNSIDYFLQSSNVTKEMDECMKNHSVEDVYYLAVNDGNQPEKLSSKNNEILYTAN